VHFQYYSPGVALSRRYPEGCKVTYQFPQYAPIEVVLSAKGPPITVDKSITIGCKLDVPKQSVRVTVAEK
jgi:hypothetical protein